MRKNLFVAAAICLILLTVIGPAAGLTGDGGSVTIAGPQSGMYARGDMITFSGTNTDSGTTYLFITGPGLKLNGAQIQSMHPDQSPVIDGDASSFQAVPVGPDNRWSYTWDTENSLIGPGTFTIHAAGAPRDLAHINNTHSDTVSFLKLSPENTGMPTGMIASTGSNEPIIITRPERHSISNNDILPPPSVVREGNRIRISGTVKGNPPPELVIWTTEWDPDPVHGGGGSGWGYVSPDPSGNYFTYIIDSSAISRIEAGNYHVVVQHPMQNKVFDISPNTNGNEAGMNSWIWNRMLNGNNDTKGTKIFMMYGPGGLQGDNSYQALIEAFKDPSVDDIIAIAPSLSATPAGVTMTETPRSVIVNNTEETAIAQTGDGFSRAGPAAGPSFEVDSIMVSPTGDLASGTPVTVAFRVNFSETGNETFPSADVLQMSTDLENPRWEYTLVLDGVENPQPDFTGRVLSVSGWVLSYPPSNGEWLVVTLSGTAPRVTSPANVTLFTVTEFDPAGNPIPGSDFILAARNNPGTDQPALSGTSVQANPADPFTTAGDTMAMEGFSRLNVIPAGFSPVNNENFRDIIGCVWYNTSVFTAVSAGNYSSSFTKKGAVIKKEQAENSARLAFPLSSPDRIVMDYSDISVNSRWWHFDMRKGDQQLVLGTLDAYTGDLTEYQVPSRYWTGTLEVPRLAAVSMEIAQLTAESEIRKRNGELPVTLAGSRVDYDGVYSFDYRRIINGVPCSKDGITVTVDPGTGKVVRYYKAWYTPENAVAAQSSPAISRDEATALVERHARICHPESSDSLRIVSADLRWMDVYNQDQYLPSPGVIPLGWYVRFDDTAIRAQDYPDPAEGWVDAQNGTLLSLNYIHRT
ncbi:MAG: YcdB/YcdC domain-containing protein [Methanoregula sp.]